MVSLERKIVKWDGAEEAVVFPSGMAAISTMCLALLKPGDRMLVSDPIYGGAEHLFRHVLPEMGAARCAARASTRVPGRAACSTPSR